MRTENLSGLPQGEQKIETCEHSGRNKQKEKKPTSLHTEDV